jgi:glycosyltransferase involved in cell wall biosynthesis
VSPAHRPGPRRVLYVHHNPDLYGSSRSLLRLVSGLDPERFVATAVLPAEGAVPERLRAMGVEVLIEPGLAVVERSGLRPPLGPPLFALRLLGSARRLRRLVRKAAADVVHANTGVVVASGPAARSAGVPHVWHVRDWFGEFPLLWALHRRLMRATSQAIIAVSEGAAAQFPDRRGLEVIHNGLPPDEYRADPDLGQRFREGRGLGEELVIGCVGRVKLGRKGQEVLVRALAALRGAGARPRLLLVGAPFRGNERHLEDLQQLVSSLGLQAATLFTGELEDPRPAYAAMDVFVLPSGEPEPFAGVVLEAMSMELPVVATATGGSPEQVEEGVTGHLVPPGDPRALAAALAPLLGDAGRRRAMGRAGRERLLREFPLSATVRAIQAVYARVSSPAPGRS